MEFPSISIPELFEKRRKTSEKATTMHDQCTQARWGVSRQLLTATSFLVIVCLLLLTENLIVCSALVQRWSPVHRWLRISRTTTAFHKRTQLFQTEESSPTAVGLNPIHDTDELLPLRRAQSVQEAVRVIKGWTSSSPSSSSSIANGLKTRQGQTNKQGFERQTHFLSTTHRASIPALMWNLLREETYQQQLAQRQSQSQSQPHEPTGKGVFFSPSLLSELIWVVGTIRQPLPPPLLPYRQLSVLLDDNIGRSDPSAAAVAEAVDGEEDGSQSSEYSLASYVITGLCTHLTIDSEEGSSSVVRGDVVAKTAIGLARMKLSWRYVDVTREKEKGRSRGSGRSASVSVGRSEGQTQSSGNGNGRAGEFSHLLLGTVAVLDGRALSNVLWSLGTLQCQWHHDLSRTLRTRLLRRVGTVAAREWNDQGVGTSLWGLQRMGVLWADLPLDVQSSICTAVCRRCFNMSGQAVGNTIYSLGRLGVHAVSLTGWFTPRSVVTHSNIECSDYCHHLCDNPCHHKHITHIIFIILLMSTSATDRMTIAIEVSIRKGGARMHYRDALQVGNGQQL